MKASRGIIAIPMARLPPSGSITALFFFSGERGEEGVPSSTPRGSHCLHEGVSALKRVQRRGMSLPSFFGSLTPVRLDTFYSLVRRFVVAPLPICHCLPEPLRSQFRFIRKPANHNMHRPCLCAASRRAVQPHALPFANDYQPNSGSLV